MLHYPIVQAAADISLLSLQAGVHDEGDLEDGMESLSLIKWYRDGQKQGLVQSVLTSSLTTHYRLHFSFGRQLYWEVSDVACLQLAAVTNEGNVLTLSVVRLAAPFPKPLRSRGEVHDQH